MDRIADLHASTSEHFDSVNFCELGDNWIEQVIGNEFTDAEENNMTITVLFLTDVIPTLNNLAKICDKWVKVASECDGNVSQDVSLEQEALWTVLQELDIQVNQIHGMIYLLCTRGLKSDSSSDDKAYAVAAANFYFNILRVPGSSAYSVFHRNLFCLCVDCLPAPDFTSDKDCSSLKEFEKVSSFYISALISLTKLLREVVLGGDSNPVEYVSKRLAELTACEVQNAIKIDTNFAEFGERELKRYKSSLVVTTVAYQALLAISDTDLNGEQDHNYMYICSQLNKHILCLRAKKSQTISQKLHTIKANAVSFLCHNLKNKNMEEFCSDVTQTALKRLCLGVIDKADFRCAISSAFVTVLFNLKVEHVAEMIQWMLLLIDSTDTKDRVFSLEVLGLLLNHSFPTDTDQLSDSLKVYLTDVPIIFAILTRCDDTSPNVRTRALTVLSQNMKCILQFMEKTKDQKTFETEVAEEINPRDLDVNGNHRFFWYNLNSLRARLNEIANILHRRIEDNNVTARKAALVALENLMVFDKTYLSRENLKFFDFAAKDANIVVRKQVMQSLSAILDTYPDNPQIQSCWLRCILPLVQDPENTVQAKALSVLEEEFLQKIFSSSETDRKSSFNVLRMASSGDFLSHQRYLQKAFSIWKSERKLRPQVVIQLEKYLDTEWEACVWFYLSNFTAQSVLPSKMSLLCVEQFQKLTKSNMFPKYMNHMLKVLNHVFKSLPSDTVLVIKDVISDTLNVFSVPVELTPTYIEVLFKSHRHLKTESQFSTFSSQLFQKCERQLIDIKSIGDPCERASEISVEELLPKCFCIAKELCQLDESLINHNILSLLKMYSACDKPPPTVSKILTPSVRAHAFAALGKICLQDEILAKDLLSVYAQELLTSDFDVIRNNLVIILIEMCKRYTSLADKYIPLISLCFKDRLYLIRYQTIILLVNLLQEGYIKWRGPLFFCLLSTLNDKREEIQELGRYSLSQLLQDKKKTLFSEHFVDSIFVFNGFPPSDNATLAQTVRDLNRFAMKGEYRRDGRMHLYKFLLESMDVKERAYLVKSICEILMNIAEAVYPLEEITECIIRDCFAILTCKEIRAFNVEQISEDVDEAQEKEFSKTELETRKIVIIDPVVPVIASLKTAVSDPGSDLAHDIIMFLKELLQDFKDSLKDILGIDKVLLQTLELEIRNDAERERAEKRLEKDPPKERKQQCASVRQAEQRNGADIDGIKSMMDDVSDLEETHVVGERCRANGPTSSEKNPKPLPTRSTRQQNKNLNPSSSSSSFPTKTYNIADATPAEAMEIHRFASTPRVVLNRVSQASVNLNISAIEKTSEPMIFEDSDEDF